MTVTTEQPQEKISFPMVAALCCALRFLTVLPVGWQAAGDGRLFPRSVYFFAPVGLLIGYLGYLVCTVTAWILPHDVVVFLALFYLAAISGFLHLDGLADSADGLLSARPRERSLEIMKDSRTGAMGVVVLILVLLGKYAALTSISFSQLGLAVFSMPLAGRAAIVMTMASQRYARAEGGLGGLFYSTGTRYAAGCAILVFAVAAFFAGGVKTLGTVFLVTMFTVFWFGTFCRLRLGGVTGDTLGAVCELTEMSMAIALAALFPQ